MNNKTEIDYLNYNDLNLVEEKIKECTDRANEAMSPQINKVIDGKSTQETRSGKNLFKLDKFTNKVVNGMTMSWNDASSIILNGKTTAQANFWFTGLSLKIPAGTYHLSFSYEDSKITYYFKSNNTNIFYGKVGSTQTLKSDVIIDTILIQIDVDKALTNQLVKIQLEKGSTATDYEPYGVMPSPDYPSEIENVKGKNLLDNKNPNYIVGATWQPTETGGKISASTTWNWVGWNLKLNMDKQYTFSYGARNSKNIYLYIRTYTDATYSTIKTKIVSDGINLQNTFKPDSEYVRIAFANNAVIEDIEIPNIQLEKGSVATRYVPYGNIQIVETGKNIAKFDQSKNTNINSWIYTSNVANNITATKKYTGDSFYATFVANVVKDEQYVFSTSTSKRISMYCYSDKLWGTVIKGLSAVGLSSAVPLKFTSNYTGQMIIGLYGTTTSVEAKDFQLEKGSIATDYEPYTEEVVHIDLKGNELCSLPNGTKDELIVKDGRAKIIKRIGKVILDGSEGWTLYSDKKHTFSLHMGQTIDKHGRAYCSHFTEIFSNKFDVANGIYSVYTNAIIISYLDCGTVDEFKTWLSNHNVTVQYELAEPYEIDLGPLEVYFTYETKKWVINELPYIQEIDRIEKGIYNLGEKYNRPKGWLPTKEWITKDNLYPIKGFDYRDWNRWVNNLNIFTTDIVVKDTIWNGASFINWEQIGKDEWR